MAQDQIAPVNHGVLSGTGTVAAEAGASGLRGMLKGAAIPPAIAAVVAGGISLYTGVTGVIAAAAAVPAGATGAAAAAATFSGVTLGLLGAVSTAAIWAAGFAVVGLLAVPVFAGLGSIFGLASGAKRGVDKVSQERGAANELQAQVAAYQAQAQAMAFNAANENAPANKYNFPPQGAPMNPAGTVVGGVQRDGMVNGQQLQLA